MCAPTLIKRILDHPREERKRWSRRTGNLGWTERQSPLHPCKRWWQEWHKHSWHLQQENWESGLTREAKSIHPCKRWCRNGTSTLCTWGISVEVLKIALQMLSSVYFFAHLCFSGSLPKRLDDNWHIEAITKWTSLSFLHRNASSNGFELSAVWRCCPYVGLMLCQITASHNPLKHL